MALTDPGIDRQIINSNVGPEAPTVVLAEACTRGDVLGYSSGWKLALATVGTAIQGLVVALADGAIGDSVPVSQNPIVGGYSGATVGGYIYVAEGVSPLGKGEITQILFGCALVRTEEACVFSGKGAAEAVFEQAR